MTKTSSLFLRPSPVDARGRMETYGVRDFQGTVVSCPCTSVLCGAVVVKVEVYTVDVCGSKVGVRVNS